MTHTDQEHELLPPKRSWGKRIVFTVVILIFMAVFAEIGLRVIKAVIRPGTQVAGITDDCDGIAFVCMGDSMTFGLGAKHNEAYPARLPIFLKRNYPGIDFKVCNIGVAGTNTSEGIKYLTNFIHSNKNNLPDYGLILYGINNRWNLHKATFWEWDEDAKKENYFDFLASKLQLNKVFKVAKENKNGLAQVVQKSHGAQFRQLLDEHGWDMFFNSFKDELLAKWISEDLKRIIDIQRKAGIQPILLTYHYERFGYLNDLIRQIAIETDVILLDIEMLQNVYASKKMLSKDKFHFNTKGYNFMARKIARLLRARVEPPEMKKRLEQKQASAQCKSS